MDTFEHRLQQFLEMENLSQAQFAAALGIQRGGLCHLLSGRNKPSYDFIVKLISSYPALNSEWLLTGRGKPYKNNETCIGIPASPATTDDLPEEDLPAEQNDLFSCTSVEDVQIAVNQEVEQTTTPSQPFREPISGDRTVERIVIFYSDGTFEER